MKTFSFLTLLLIATLISLAQQKESFDVISYTIPAGWQQTTAAGGVQLSVTDSKTNAYAMAVITKTTTSNASAGENFNNDWEKLVKATVQLNEAPVMQKPSNENGWDILSGNANYTDGNNKGKATLLTATGGGQTVSVVLMTNTQKYQDDLLKFIQSLELIKTNNSQSATANTTGNTTRTSITGLWCDYVNETSGYMNGMPMYTAGYFRKEYVFNADGTYEYRAKNWSAYMKEILFIRETGVWSLNGNQLTISPKQGQGGWWSKAKSGRTVEWGNMTKASTFKPEKATYAFEIKYYPGTQSYSLIIKSANSTQRENTQQGETHYAQRTIPSLIDNPPGFAVK